MIIAVVSTLNAGYSSEREYMQKLGFLIGERIEVENIAMSQSSTSISLKGFKGSFNSVFFEFEENGEEIDIYSDKRFNPYLIKGV